MIVTNYSISKSNARITLTGVNVELARLTSIYNFTRSEFVYLAGTIATITQTSGSDFLLTKGALARIDSDADRLCIVYRDDVVRLAVDEFSFDAGARLRVGQLTTLGDLKTLGSDDPLILDSVGTGGLVFSNNKATLSASAGTYSIRYSRRRFPYFSGKSQQVEITFDGMGTEAGATKRVGYFCSSAVAPYDADKDGFWLENDGTTYRLICSRFGVETLNVPIAEWNGEREAKAHDFSKFTVVEFDYLWLGGAVLRMFVKTGSGFRLAHVFHYAGTETDTFTRSPNHCVRWEVRGPGSLRAICAHVSTEGSTDEAGKQRSINSGSTGITCANVGTVYPVVSLRANAAYRERVIKQVGAGAFVTSVNDQGLVQLHLNPTLSAPLTYSDVSNSGAQEGKGNGTITITNPGTVLFSMYLATGVTIPPNVLERDFLSHVGMTIDNVSDQLVLSITPISGSLTAFGAINFKEF